MRHAPLAAYLLAGLTFTEPRPSSPLSLRFFAEKRLTPDGGTMPLFWLAASLILCCVHHCFFRKCKYAADPEARAQTSNTIRGGHCTYGHSPDTYSTVEV